MTIYMIDSKDFEIAAPHKAGLAMTRKNKPKQFESRKKCVKIGF